MLRDGVTLYFLRHGETDWNVVQRYQGQTDIPLNALGRAQAHRNGEVLARLLGARQGEVDYVSSPLSRASETMALARAAMGLEPEAFARDDRLMEQRYGTWEGKLYGELPLLDPEGFAARARDKWGWSPAGGESYRQLSERIAGWLQGLERDTVAASHGGVSRALRGLVLGLAGPEVTELEMPQDKVLVLTPGRMTWE